MIFSSTAHRLLVSGLILILMLGAGLAGAGTAGAEGLVVRSLSVSPSKILADGGSTTVTVTAEAAGQQGADDPNEVTLTATLGSFGAASGPSRIVLALEPAGNGARVAVTELFGDGRAGTAALAARVGESVRSAAVVMVGEPAAINFSSPSAGAVLDAESAPRVAVQVRDADGVTVPGIRVSLITSGGTLAASGSGSSVGVTTDLNGRAAAILSAEPGSIRLTARAGAAFATRSITLHGPAVSLQAIAIRSAVSLGEDGPPGTLVASLLDAGGRPVPGYSVVFSTDRDDVSVVQSGQGESARTDGSGRAGAHLVAVDAEAPGLVTILVRAAGLEDRIEVRIVGPPAQLVLGVTAAGLREFQVSAIVLDLDGFAVPSGVSLAWTAATAGVTFEPDESAVQDGVAQTLVRLSPGVRGEVQVEASLVDAAAALTAQVTLPTLPVVEGTPLTTGLNVLIWTGDAVPVADAVAPISGLVVAVWQFDETDGWTGYFPGAGLGGNFDLRTDQRIYLFLAGPTALPDVVPAS